MKKSGSYLNRIESSASVHSICYLPLSVILLLFVCLAPQVLLSRTSCAAQPSVGEAALEQKFRKHILIITSQPYITDWFAALNDAMREKLFTFLTPDSKLSYEYIGSEGLTDADYNTALIELLRKKYVNIKLDMVIAVMPTGSQFMLDHGESLFPKIAVIFILPSKAQIPKVTIRPRTGLVRSPTDAIAKTIERVHALLPDTENLVVVSGGGKDDLYYQAIAEESLKDRKWPKTVEYLKGLPLNELSGKVKNLPRRSAILMLTYLQDRTGAPLTTVQVMDAISADASAPIFSFYDTILGHGIVGGKLTSAEAYGDAAAATALKMFTAGQVAPFMETVAEPRDRYDWRQIKKWQIPASRLPSGSEIRFRKTTFWQDYAGMIALVSSIIVLQALLILALLFNLIRRKRAETALRLSEKKYHEIFHNAVMGIFQSTPDGKYLSVNPALAHIFGYQTPGEMVMEIHDIEREVYVNSEDRKTLKKRFAEEGVVRGFQVEYKRKDGFHFWISISGKAVRDEQGNILYYEGTVEDITQRKRTEEELYQYRDRLEALVRERTEELERTNQELLSEIQEHARTEKALLKSETLYRDLVESANSVILRWKSDGIITFINTFALQFFGYTKDEIVGQNILGTIVPEMETSGRDLSEMVQDIVKNPAAYEGNVNENVRKNGQRVWVAWTNRPLKDENDQLTEILSIGTDITKLVEAENELRKTMAELDRAKERAESADRLKSAFLATMSHELRTPLNSIIGFTGILIQGLVGPLNEEQDKQLNMVYNSARHLLDLINDVLDISKIEADQLTVMSERFDLRASLDKVLAGAQPMADKKGLKLTAAIAPEIDMIVSDRRRVEQILLNLISNAIKFTEKGFVQIDCAMVNGQIIMDVKDSGIGIKAEDMGILFSAFRQIESGLTRRYEGTGLGLSICKKLSRLLGGEITVVSEWGRGSTFSLILPKEKKSI